MLRAASVSYTRRLGWMTVEVPGMGAPAFVLLYVIYTYDLIFTHTYIYHHFAVNFESVFS